MPDLDDLKSATVAVVGDVMLDRYWWGNVSRISPEAPVPVVSLEKTTTVPGGAANVAVNIASLGATPILFGCVGIDPEADELSIALRSKRVAPENLIKVPARRTCVKTRVVAHGQQVVRVDSEDVIDLENEHSEQIFGQFREQLADIDLIILSDYAKGTLSQLLLAKILETCADADKPVLVDPKGKDFGKYKGATILTPNRRESADALKLDESMQDLTLEAGKQILSSFGFPSVLITESEDGMTLFRQGEDPLHFDAMAHEVYDVTGAGDTVIATLGVALAAGFDLPGSVSFANAAAGIAVGQIGTSAVDAAHLADVINGLSKGVAKL